ncbi:MAG: hypothetical protein CMM52_16420 [Rhodospirillaceae bacterium]|nr:hypothetical protein [Rhodospirillaceae bacterium]|tara:strand:- start:18590 stop:18838 length:249 start_codon:yes stop_codon:yes gene_type:complete
MYRQIPVIVLVSIAVLFPNTAFAYVDPGILPIVYQALYALIFGAVTVFFLRPWGYLKSKFGRQQDEDKTEEENTDIDNRDKE